MTKECKICGHLERNFLEKLLEQGISPRAIARRVGGTTRLSLAHHRDRCLPSTEEEDEA